MAGEQILELDYGTAPATGRVNPVIAWGTQPPLTGAWVAGDRIYNINIVSLGTSGWICKTSGSPGIWTTLPETVA